MQTIIDKETYNQKIDEFHSIYESENISLEQKISLCEEIMYSDYCKENNRADCLYELIYLYNKAGMNKEIINFIMVEYKCRFKDNEGDAKTHEWADTVLFVFPELLYYVVDAEIALGDYSMAKETLLGLKENRLSMLEKHQNDWMRDDCIQFYAHTLIRYAEIAILEGDANEASFYLSDPFWNDYNHDNIKRAYYIAKLWSGKIDSSYKDEVSLQRYAQVANLDINNECLGEKDKEMIIDSNYQLGLIYATDTNYLDKNKAKIYLEKARSLGYPITNDEISKLLLTVTEKSKGCYVATCVYGSYDCPQVWALRRFRDEILSANILGRLFIKCYYAVSPTIVKCFGKYKWFNKMFKKPLDKMVSELKQNGIEDTPYNDR